MIKKNLAMILRVAIMVAMILLFFGAWSIQWQETINSQVFWANDRLVAGIGFIFAVTGWIFWETYVSAKKQNLVFFIIACTGILVGTIMVNGVIGLIGGLFALGLIGASFALDWLQIVSLKGQKG